MMPDFDGKKPEPSLPHAIFAGNLEEAAEIQETLRHRVIAQRTIATSDIRTIAGADAAYDRDRIHAAIAVLAPPALEVLETVCVTLEVPLPYIPGLLAFREGPAILDAFSQIHAAVDLIIVNGHGLAHPKRFGIASHLGLILDIPSVGIAKRLMTGTFAFPGTDRGSIQPITDGDEIVGMAVRTVAGAKPVIVSVGHKVDLPQAVEVALMVTRKHRITEPLWNADQQSRKCRDARGLR